MAQSIRQSPLEGPGVWASGKAQIPPPQLRGCLSKSFPLTIKVCFLFRGLREVASWSNGRLGPGLPEGRGDDKWIWLDPQLRTSF